MSENLPLLIPSYNRPNAPLPALATRVLGDDYPWFVFVRASQFRDYAEHVDPEHLVAFPDSKAKDLGTTRNSILRWAEKHGYRHIFDWDDDVFNFGVKLPGENRYKAFRYGTNDDPWFETPGYWEEASRLAGEVFDLYPEAVVGCIQNQRWPDLATVKVQCGKTPRRTKIVNVERVLDNSLLCPREFRFHGEDIGNTAMYLQYGWQVFTICSLTYQFTPETNVKLPSTLRDRDEERNRQIHAKEYESLMGYEIRDYLRVNKAYSDGTYMYGDVDWRKFRKITGQVSYTHEFSLIRDQVPLDTIPVRLTT